MYINWEYYKVFYSVARYGSFTQAARVLGNNQPNITHTMNKLEEQLNCVLFTRTHRGVNLTPEGQLLYERISNAAMQIQDAEEALGSAASFSQGSIAISTTETALNIYLSDQLRDFHHAYPGIRLHIFNHSTPQAIQAVKSGEVDFAVVSTPIDPEPSLHTAELCSFREILVGGKGFSALADHTLSLQEISQYPLISLSAQSMTRRFYRQLFLAHDATLSPDTEAATTDQLLTLVKSELGLAFMPEPMALDALQRGEIVKIALHEPIPPRTVCLVYDKRRPLNTAAREFRHRLVGSAKEVSV